MGAAATLCPIHDQGMKEQTNTRQFGKIFASGAHNTFHQGGLRGLARSKLQAHNHPDASGSITATDYLGNT